MKSITYPNLLGIILCLLLFLSGCTPGNEITNSPDEPVSHFQVMMTSENPEVVPASGSSVIVGLEVQEVEEGAIFELDLQAVSMVQLVIQLPAGSQTFDVDVTANSTNVGTLSIDRNYVVSGTTEYVFGSLDIQREYLVPGQNTIGLSTTGSLLTATIKLLPREVYALPVAGKDYNVLNTTLYTQFARIDSLFPPADGAPNQYIWTRGYGLSRGVQMIPGPTLRFSPGDLVNVKIVNELNPARYADLDVFEAYQNRQVAKDEELASIPIHGEVNVPHNLNNTNLHVHGLHVDPSKDDVTIVIIPEGESTDLYDAPHTHSPVTDTADLNPWSIPDQGVKAGEWNYSYKIPKNHLPGTHWFHPHKHGATSAQVENGMAGTIVIQEPQDSSVIPYTSAQRAEFEAWSAAHDRVLAIQEISNYGLQKGNGSEMGDTVTAAQASTITVNGLTNYQIEMSSGEIERWRIVNAGTNHKSFSHIWLGRHTDNGVESETIYLVAVDGITLPQSMPITKDKPALMAPGNRSDFLVKLTKPGTYTLFKKYGTSTVKNNPYGSQYSYDGYATYKKLSLVPVIRTYDAGDSLDVTFATDYTKERIGWQPYSARTPQIDTTDVLTVTVTESSAPVTFPSLPDNTHLSKLSPITKKQATGYDPPPYVSPINRSDILQYRPITFDISGLSLKVTDTVNSNSQRVNQFTLNGRFFELNDPLGNPYADKSISKYYTGPNDLLFQTDSVSDLEAITDAGEKITFEDNVPTKWTTMNKSKIPVTGLATENSGATDSLTVHYFANPGYYQEITKSSTEWSYVEKGTPHWEDISGIDQMAVVNSNYTKDGYDMSKVTLPSLPRAKTAEEWILINNSDVGHPFHVHINPFFVAEVGVLSYESGKWLIRAQTAESEPQRPVYTSGTKSGSIVRGEAGKVMSVQGVVGNWWDTITIPPHGYVKVKYWINVPNQVENSTTGTVSVTDNDNRTGIWVYHCHILRHEDRGMMMPIITQPLKEDKE